MQPTLSVVIPCYNEEQNIRLGALDKVVHYLEKQKYQWEVIVVDDGSTDESKSLIKAFMEAEVKDSNFRFIENPHQGKAGTVIKGMQEAKGDYILFSDLDQATPLNQIEKLMPWIECFDIVIGSRKGKRSGAPFLRRLMGPGFIFIRNIVLGLGNIEDTQCGFKLFKNNVGKDVFNRLKLFKTQKYTSGPRVTAGFDVEVLFVANRLGYQVKEVEVEWHYVDSRRVSPVMDSLDALIDILKIRLYSLQGIY